ncbi:MAG: hypothetical protein MHPSP_004248, partial [Paramarteilia canceri]
VILDLLELSISYGKIFGNSVACFNRYSKIFAKPFDHQISWKFKNDFENYYLDHDSIIKNFESIAFNINEIAKSIEEQKIESTMVAITVCKKILTELQNMSLISKSAANAAKKIHDKSCEINDYNIWHKAVI